MTKNKLEKQKMHKFVALLLTIIFAANLIVTGVPVDSSVESTSYSTIEVDSNSTGNGTHKEL